MKILYDHQTFRLEVGGIPRYYLNLINTIKSKTTCTVETSVIINRNNYFQKNEGFVTINRYNFSILNYLLKKRPGRMIIEYINKTYTLYKLKKNNYDVLHLTNENCSYVISNNINIPIVITIHDLIPEIFPKYFPNSEIRLRKRKEIIDRADHIICISNSTKNDLLKYYQVEESKISIIYHGKSEMLSNLKNEITPIPANKKYLLYVGDRIAGYKNFWNMVNSLSSWLQNHEDIILVCIGSNFSVNELKKIEDLNLTTKLIAFYANETIIGSIYHNSICFIYPSLYEGFGLPILEAMQTGCPILLSKASCLPEIAEDAAIYFDPETFDGFIEGLNTLILDIDLKNDMIQKQKKRLNSFSWEKTAIETVEAYSKAIRSHGTQKAY